jgi:uncharacterized protein YqhQ
MFFTLLLVTFLLATAVSIAVVRFFENSISRILIRITNDELAEAWVRYIKFAAYVVGISGGVRIYSLEQYISARYPGAEIVELTAEVWTLEVYGTLIGTLRSLAWMLLLVFVVALIAYVIMRAFELKAERRMTATQDGHSSERE